MYWTEQLVIKNGGTKATGMVRITYAYYTEPKKIFLMIKICKFNSASTYFFFIVTMWKVELLWQVNLSQSYCLVPSLWYSFCLKKYILMHFVNIWQLQHTLLSSIKRKRELADIERTTALFSTQNIQELIFTVP